MGGLIMSEFVFINKDFKEIKKYELGIVVESNDNEMDIQFVNSDHIYSIPKQDLREIDIEQTGDQFEVKVCNVCNRVLPTEFFQKNQNGIGNRTIRRPSCNDCRSIIDGTNVSSKDRRIWERVKPYLQIWECPVCKKRTIPGLTSKVVLDHDHNTGIPRAWICDSCNTGLGRFKDDIDLLKNAINYLRDNSK